MIVEHRSSLRGEIRVPGDRSISHKAIIMASLAKGTSEINDVFMSEDCISTINCFRQMGVSIEIRPNNCLKITGNGIYGLVQPRSSINTGKSNTAFRLLLGILVGQTFPCIVTRDPSVQRRLVSDIVMPLKTMGAKILGREDATMCPLNVQPSTLNSTTYNLNLENRHVKSSLLLAGLYANDKTIIKESVPYRNHTELMLQYFGAKLSFGKNGRVTIYSGNDLSAKNFNVPGDISIAAYFIVAASIIPHSEIMIRNVGVNQTRNGIIDVLRSMGAEIDLLNEHLSGKEPVVDIHVTSSNLSSTTIDAKILPRLYNELPAFIVAACAAKGTSKITNLRGYKIFENETLSKLCKELTKLGAKITINNDTIEILGGVPLKGRVVESYGNKALTFALSTAAIYAEDETLIRRSQVLETAFPDFLPVLNSL
ncbi:MAG: 3-phosphoshikimate 1-carboxyvinyltransferase [Clostridiales bacterium]|nr:3-phosphoshikimate 1-carboxyvinyltransferase [Clostridiales bacterium]